MRTNLQGAMLRALGWALGGLALVVLVASGVVLGLRWERDSAARRLASQLDWPDVVPASSVVGAPDFRDAARRIVPSVVSIDKFEEVWGFFRSRPTVEQTSGGSGVIISDEGYILTNNHVVEGARQLMVRLFDGRSYEATIVGRDPFSDLALLRIRADNLQPATMGSSANLEIGQWVLAVGSPLGYDHTLSVGVVSSLNRTLPSDGRSILINAIQTDAAINRGNSGGALCDATGRLVGINTAIASIGGGSIGIGFAIPIDRARRVVNDILEHGRARYGTMGVVIDGRAGLLQRDRVRQELAQILGSEPPDQGLLIREVVAGSAAARLGIREFDILLEVDGRPMREPIDLFKFQLDSAPGQQARIRVWQRGETKSLTIRLEDRFTR